MSLPPMIQQSKWSLSGHRHGEGLERIQGADYLWEGTDSIVNIYSE